MKTKPYLEGFEACLKKVPAIVPYFRDKHGFYMLFTSERRKHPHQFDLF